VTLVNSFVVYEEVSAVPSKENRKLIIDFIDNATVYIAKDKLDEVMALSSYIIETGVKYMDAAHTACAIIGNCDYLITTDKRLLKYKSDKKNIINPVDFIRMWEDNDNVNE
jgi:predicted nucleic acid-binding protein